MLSRPLDRSRFFHLYTSHWNLVSVSGRSTCFKVRCSESSSTQTLQAEETGRMESAEREQRHISTRPENAITATRSEVVP